MEMSAIIDTIRRLAVTPPQSQWPIIAASVVSTVAALRLANLALDHRTEQVVPSARATLLPKISKEEASALPYPPDALPGGRYVDSPYGVIRVYEWGPEYGRKVLFIHGITTPCIALGAVAQGMVDKGCRVMLFDLWGRGYTDAPNDLPYDVRLYSTQILTVLTSSALSWTGPEKFDLIGYSLGGGIATAFTSYHPSLVRSLILLAPAGLVRPEHMSSRSQIVNSTGIVPECLISWLCKKRLLAGPMYANENKEIDLSLIGTAEEGAPDEEQSLIPLSRTRPDIHVQQAVQWQLRNHGGFVLAFLSSIRHAPITEQQEHWRRLQRVRSDKVLLIAGTKDPIIFPNEVRQDAEALLGTERIAYSEIDSTHDFPVTESRDVIKEIMNFWEEE